MLTRSAVAKRLNRSLATVRRLEGRELFPRRDARGVHVFDEDEVSELGRRLQAGDATAARGTWLLRRTPTSREADRGAASTEAADAHKVRELLLENGGLRAELGELKELLAELAAELDCVC